MFSPLLSTHAEGQPARQLRQVGKQLFAGLLFFLLGTVMSGCSLVPSSYFSQDYGRPQKTMIEEVPFFPQDDLQCGPAALAMALNWSGVAATPSQLSSEVYTPGLKGSLQGSLIGGARRHGRVAYPIEGIEAMMTEVTAGNPVIVLVNLSFAWYPKWHYAVVIGYDQAKKKVILHSGLTAGEVLGFWTFNNIWRRGDYWGLLVLPPDRLPATATETAWLKAVAGLEKAGEWQGAASGYGVALERWDKSFIAWMGLGNSRYALRELDAAAEAFRQATQLQPKNGMAYNNWANVLAEQGQMDEALTAAQRAVELGGPFQDIFRQTLEEIKESKGRPNR